MSGPKRGNKLNKLLNKIKINNDTACWEWIGSRSYHGYGRFYYGRKVSIPSHRISYELFIGEIPDGFVIMHKCDNPPCCNPFHLELGTQKDNIHDAQGKGRMKLAIHPSYTHYKTGCRCDRCKKCASEVYFKNKQHRNK